MNTIKSDVYRIVNVPGRRITAETISEMYLPAPVGDVTSALVDLESEGKVKQVRTKGRADDVTRIMWVA